ncbi:Hypothetical predicted protein [Pelobates cultripes]|uniref:Uncharacterized protein n=1 Tax=Pelobates cultripes TaxID=61616 RepID=A0AAD1WBL8_PELCU|nr:Hypothetical predicted protein [Pelobates cultripes]
MSPTVGSNQPKSLLLEDSLFLNFDRICVTFWAMLHERDLTSMPVTQLVAPKVGPAGQCCVSGPLPPAFQRELRRRKCMYSSHTCYNLSRCRASERAQSQNALYPHQRLTANIDAAVGEHATWQ